MSELLPAEATPNGGEARNVEWPKSVDGGYMSRFYDHDENIDYIQAGVDMETFWTKETKIGYKRRTDEFESEFMKGLIDFKYRRLAEDATKAIARFVEWCSTNYVYGDSTVMAKFSNQSTDRQCKLDATTANVVTGVAWSNTSSSYPYVDIVKMNDYFEGFGAAGSLTRGFVGHATAMYLALNADLKDRVKYVQELAGGVIGTRIADVTIRKVIGQRYKFNSSDSLMIGYPGLGSLYENTWASRNEREMMRNAANTYEWALFAGDDRIGVTYMAKVDTETHKNPLETNIRIVKEEEPSIQYKIILEKRFCPAIEDFAKFIVLDKVATVTS